MLRFHRTDCEGEKLRLLKSFYSSVFRWANLSLADRDRGLTLCSSLSAVIGFLVITFNSSLLRKRCLTMRSSRL